MKNMNDIHDVLKLERKDLTVEQNCRRLAELARKLPILENEKPE